MKNKLGKIQIDKAAWLSITNVLDMNKACQSVVRVWKSNDKDYCIVFECLPHYYPAAIAELTLYVVRNYKASFVKPAKLRKYRKVSLEDRRLIQELYSSKGKGEQSVTRIAELFRISPTLADPFCISDHTTHPELFLTDEEVDDHNEILISGKWGKTTSRK